jgi:hypothetical protein
MLCVPTDKFETVMLATPDSTGAVPNMVEKSLKVTVPVGVGKPFKLAARLAVNVTGWLKEEGFAELETLTLEPPRFKNTVTTESANPVTTRSGAPSLLKSPTCQNPLRKSY